MKVKELSGGGVVDFAFAVLAFAITFAVLRLVS